jgi:hypothetical protein
LLGARINCFMRGMNQRLPNQGDLAPLLSRGDAASPAPGR